jgi:hypothetical protein
LNRPLIFFISCLVILIFPFHFVNGQTNEAVFPQWNYGQAPDSLFSDSFTERYSGHDYVVVHKSLDIKILEKEKRLAARMKHHQVIKILSEEGVNKSIVGIPYLRFQDLESVENIRAQLVKPDGSIQKLDTANIRHIELNEQTGFYEFQLSDAAPGDVMEYSFEMERDFVRELPPFYLSEPVPVLQAGVELLNSPFLRYDVKSFNISGVLEYQTDRIWLGERATIFTGQEAEYRKKEQWFMYDIPPTEPEPFSGAYNSKRAQLRFQWKEFGNPRQVIETSWEVVVAELERDDGLLKNINKNDTTFQFSVPDSVAGRHAKIRYVFEEIVSMSNFSGDQNFHFEGDLSPAFNGEEANKGALLQILFLALQDAELDPRLVLVSNPEVQTGIAELPSKLQFTDLIVAVRKNAFEWLFLDPSRQIAEPGFVDQKLLNQKGLMMLGNGEYEWVRVKAPDFAYRQDFTLTAGLEADGTLTGKIEGTLFGYLAEEAKKELLKPDVVLRDFIKGSFLGRYMDTGVENDELDLSDSSSVSISADITIQNYASAVDEGLLYRPLVIGYLEEQPFQDEKRSQDIEFRGRESIDMTSRVTVPDGYRLEQKAGEVEHDFSGARLWFSLIQQKSTFFQELVISLNQITFSTESYPQVRAMYEGWFELSNRELLIKKP